MEISENTVLANVNYFKDELIGFYDASEIEQLLQITFFHCLKFSRTDLSLRAEENLSHITINQIKKVVEELKTNKPLAYILGEWEFYGLSLIVNEHTLIPRQETEELVQLIVNENKMSKNLSILDVGTGTGCIALALRKNISHANVFAFDVSKEAIKVASANADRNNLEVTFSEIDILKDKVIDSKGEYNIIVSNPPYIPLKEKKVMHKNVLDYEPSLALFVDNEKPLLFYNAIADFALTHLKENGRLYFEINENYGKEVKLLLMDKKFKNINIVKDINDKDRIVSCNLD